MSTTTIRRRLATVHALFVQPADERFLHQQEVAARTVAEFDPFEHADAAREALARMARQPFEVEAPAPTSRQGFTLIHGGA